jgi:hypothetical protein
MGWHPMRCPSLGVANEGDECGIAGDTVCSATNKVRIRIVAQQSRYNGVTVETGH